MCARAGFRETPASYVKASSHRRSAVAASNHGDRMCAYAQRAMTRHGELALVQSHGQLVALQLGRACDGDVGIRLHPHRVSAASPHRPRPRYCRPSSIFCPPHTFMHARACFHGCCALTNTLDCTTCNTREGSKRLMNITAGWSSLTKPLAWRLSS